MNRPLIFSLTIIVIALIGVALLNTSKVGHDPTTPSFILKQAKMDLRTVQTGLNSYYVDHEAYPDSLSKLTTPVSFLTSIPVDRYSTANSQIRYVQRPQPIVYSVGPDGDDDEAIIEYDPSNGSASNGDVILIVK